MSALTRTGRRAAFLGVVGALSFAALAALAVAGAAPAFAHASLAESTPSDGAILEEAPTEVALRFTEPVEVSDDPVKVYDDAGARLDRGGASLEPGGSVLRLPLPVSVWFGGLVFLALALRSGRPSAGSAEIDRGALVRRCSRVATVALVAVVASGTVYAIAQTRSVDALTSTTYGRLLLVKVGVAVLLATVAGTYEVTVVARVSEFDEVSATTRVVVAP